MTITNYIQDLLYRYDCVIIPNFGGFVTNKVSAKVSANTIYPPSKHLGFNTHLTHNDGLLANYIASSKNISFTEATNIIDDTVSVWTKTLNKGALTLDKIGIISKNQDSILVFEPVTDVNYLSSSYGLSKVNSVTVTRVNKDENVILAVSVEKIKKSSSNGFIKYAATAAILLTLGYTSWNAHQNKLQNQMFAKEQQQLNNKIQAATFIIDSPLPTLELTVGKEKVAKSFHLIAGAFQSEENALKKLSSLQKKGFSNAYIFGKNKWGLTQVAYNSYSTRDEAYKNLSVIREKDSEQAWLLVDNQQ